ncbi:hypothetical protein VPHG_00083 [Vibrio phage 11895-B1]|uniref:hypothetical protein n=1 Tax=Vibrio phage 11895-B1 TaxID=754075 RepID=UPI0002C11364|nr:hypothetical protein VPHG_00083 [Vibrio phage 11895-B1]AGH32150.1 hypothetical protein VPHG_00083 [Vibrio phage 11895-B1]
MTNTHSATHLRYVPRNTIYDVLHHNIMIKSSDDSWKLGCVYQDIASSTIYSRPYDMFAPNNWEII